MQLQNTWHFSKKSGYIHTSVIPCLPEKQLFHPHLPPALDHLLWRHYVRSHGCIMKMCLQKCQHSPFVCFPHTHRQKDVEMLKRPPSPVLCPRRVRNSELLPGDQTVRSSLPVFSQMPPDSMTAQALLLLAALLLLPRAGAASCDLLLARGCSQPSLIYSEPSCPMLAPGGCRWWSFCKLAT